VLFSCSHIDPNKQIDEGKVTGDIYHSKELGWTIEIPANWKIVSKDEVQKNDQKGKEAMSKVYKGDIDMKTLKNLISFQKNMFNVFASTSQSFKEDSAGEYNHNCKMINQIIYQTYIGQGIKADSSSGKEIIQGLVFNTFYATIYGRDGKPVLHQILYSRLINGYDFGVNINYNNDADKETLVNAFKNSKFEK
jgi:hypothetical protein